MIFNQIRCSFCYRYSYEFLWFWNIFQYWSLRLLDRRRPVFTSLSYRKSTCEAPDRSKVTYIRWSFNPHTLVAHKRCEWGCFSTSPRWRSRLFLNLTSLTPHQIFDAHHLENTNLSPYSFHFSVAFYIKIMFWVRWFYSLSKRMRFG